jgi:hypothetical protein
MRARLHTIPAVGPRARAALLAFWFGALVLAVQGCGTSGSLVPNLPPETVVFVSGPVDTVNHVVRLRWFGSDSDGDVERYEFKWIYEAGQEPSGYDSSTWFSTTRVDSVFTVFTPNGVSMPTFVIRAVDDDGEPDPTPARQPFTFTNQPPTVTFLTVPTLPDTTFPVATLRWTANDPDGVIPVETFLVWLDGQEDDPLLVNGTSVTLPPDRFKDGTGAFVTGPRKAYVRAIDTGGAVSEPDSFAWQVLPPVGEVLLIDDVPEFESGPIDGSYTDALDRQLGPGNYTVLRLQNTNPFRTPEDLTATFGLFESIVWYADNAPGPSGTLAIAEPAIRSHLAAGKNVFLLSVWAVGTAGVLTQNSTDPEAFLSEIVGADSVIVNEILNTTNFSISSDAVITPGSAVPYDPLLAIVIADRIEAFVLNDPADAAYVAAPPILSPNQTAPWPIAVDRVPDGGTGRFVFFAFPLRLLGGTAPGQPDPFPPDAHYGERTVREVLARFGHGVAP